MEYKKQQIIYKSFQDTLDLIQSTEYSEYKKQQIIYKSFQDTLDLIQSTEYFEYKKQQIKVSKESRADFLLRTPWVESTQQGGT